MDCKSFRTGSKIFVQKSVKCPYESESPDKTSGLFLQFDGNLTGGQRFVPSIVITNNQSIVTVNGKGNRGFLAVPSDHANGLTKKAEAVAVGKIKPLTAKITVILPKKQNLSYRRA